MTFPISKVVLGTCLLLSPCILAAAQLTIAWDDNSNGETGFRVERSTDRVHFAQVATVGANVGSYVDTSVVSGTEYSYRVAAYNNVSVSPYSNVANVTTAPASIRPSITTQPISAQTVPVGGKVFLSVTVSGVPLPALQWKKNGVAIAGATGPTHSLEALTTNDAGTYSVVASNSAGTATSNNSLIAVSTPVATVSGSPAVGESPTVATPAALTKSPLASGSASVFDADVSASSGGPGVSKILDDVPQRSRLVNLSVRAVPGPDDQALLLGFVVVGGTKPMLLRAIGPGLKTYTDAKVFEDPVVTLFDGARILKVNDNWDGSQFMKACFTRVGAFPLPEASKDAAVLSSFLPRSYTAKVTGSGSGLAMAEIYDLDLDSKSAGRLMILSARASAAAGDGVLIVGFVIGGDSPLRLLIRAVGPTLSERGVVGLLMDPKLRVHHNDALVAQNDNWGGEAQLKQAFVRCGAFPLSEAASKDAALIVTLNPGAYTIVVSGAAETSGTALAEVYELE